MLQRVVAGVGERENRYNQHQKKQQEQQQQQHHPEAHQQQHEQQMSNNNQAPRNQVGSQSSRLEAPVQQPTGRALSSASSSRARFIKSKSSPSSLTTHKFGLRPTPSPPRLIIDHQTGDIVERYPEQRVYLRTYQPIDDNTNTTQNDEPFSEDDDTTQNQVDSASFATSSLQQPHQQQESAALLQPPPAAAAAAAAATSAMTDFNQHTNTSSRPARSHGQQQSGRHGQVIPPPHAGKVYFAPPVTSNNLFEPQLQQQQQQMLATHQQAPIIGASIRQTLNNLSDNERTDIAILTEPDDAYDARTAPQLKITATSASKASALLAKQQPRPKVISTNASKLYGQPAHSRSPSIRSGSGGGGGGGANSSSTDKWKAAAQHQQLRRERIKRQQTLAAIEDFDLYNFCFNFRIFMVLLVSAIIIYLLGWTLNTDCHRYRPTYAYISIISASVNLIFVIIFTLFWYCTSVSRTLYQNLSSSAFIVTIYSILVCVNLTIGILFFFINTCHFQKLLMSHTARSHMASSSPMLFAADESASISGGGEASHLPLSIISGEELDKERVQQSPPHYDSARRQQLAFEEIIETIEQGLGESDKRRWQRHETSMKREADKQQQHSNQMRQRRRAQTGDGDDATVLDDQLNPQQTDEPPPIITTTTSTTAAPQQTDFFNQDHASGYLEVPEQSPLEAAWHFVKDQSVAFWRLFYRFLLHYDLKFVGALHTICAACFQYLAIKVAVVRSFYCSPSELYA